jgi:hypothetical protein
VDEFFSREESFQPALDGLLTLVVRAMTIQATLFFKIFLKLFPGLDDGGLEKRAMVKPHRL